MDQKKIVVLGCSAVVVTLLKLKKVTMKKNRNARRVWVRDIYLRRRKQGLYDNLIRELQLGSPELFFNFVRMAGESFENLISLCGCHMVKYSPREAIKPELRLMVTLRFLATGDSYPSLGYAFRIAPSTICNIIHETCSIIWQLLSPIYLKALSEEQWINIAKDFQKRWQMPNCIGSIDGKHIRIQAPPHSGSQYFNYKKFHSIVLLAVCDAKYMFTYVDIGAYGSQSDGGVLKNTNFGRALQEGTLNISNGQLFPGDDNRVPLYFVGDQAFPLQINLMRPYSKPRQGILQEDKIIFNYRLSRARRTIENSFGIMVARFRIFHREICAKPETVDRIIKATTCLHNFIRHQKESSSFYCNETYVDHVNDDGRLVPGRWRREIPTNLAFFSLGSRLRFGNRNYAREAFNFRDYLKDYFNGIGKVPWQRDYVTRT